MDDSFQMEEGGPLSASTLSEMRNGWRVVLGLELSWYVSMGVRLMGKLRSPSVKGV
jgi:hypothetical protein